MRLVSATIPGLVIGLMTAAAPLTAQDAGVSAELVIATGVEDREPVGEGTTFPGDVGQLAAWSSITGAEGTTIEHVWRFPEGDIEAVVPLSIGGSPWRTWSTKQIPPEWAGDWVVEVRDAAGNVLATANITVGP
jgi:Protein of unknown function (DUF2914)